MHLCGMLIEHSEFMLVQVTSWYSKTLVKLEEQCHYLEDFSVPIAYYMVLGDALIRRDKLAHTCTPSSMSCFAISLFINYRELLKVKYHALDKDVYMQVLCLAPTSSELGAPVIHVYDGQGENQEVALLDKLHSSPITFIEVGSVPTYTFIYTYLHTYLV